MKKYKLVVKQKLFNSGDTIDVHKQNIIHTETIGNTILIWYVEELEV